MINGSLSLIRNVWHDAQSVFAVRFSFNLNHRNGRKPAECIKKRTTRTAAIFEQMRHWGPEKPAL